jgi:hypothetical protein
VPRHRAVIETRSISARPTSRPHRARLSRSR